MNIYILGIWVMLFALLIVTAIDAEHHYDYHHDATLVATPVLTEDQRIAKDKSIFESYKLECKEEYGAQYIDLYMTCATEHMKRYLDEQT